MSISLGGNPSPHKISALARAGQDIMSGGGGYGSVARKYNYGDGGVQVNDSQFGGGKLNELGKFKSPVRKNHDYEFEKKVNPPGQSRGLTRLRYEVVAHSSEDPMHPASRIQVDYQNIVDQANGVSAQSNNGWCSQKFCAYPQEIVLKFEAPLRLKTLQILSHEFKISSRIELFYIPYFDPKTQPDGPTTDQVARIGNFSFENIDPTMKPKLMREMKTVHLSDIYTQYIKIDLYQPYENSLNIFQQVSLVSVSCIGL